MIEIPMLLSGKIISFKVRIFTPFLADCRKKYVFMNGLHCCTFLWTKMMEEDRSLKAGI